MSLECCVDVEAERLRRSAMREPTEAELLRLAARIYDSRRARDGMFSNRLFGEPAWDMLLALYCLPRQGTFLTVGSLSNAAGTPTTTGLRWQEKLTEAGLIERGPRTGDRRTEFVRLTQTGKALLRTYLTDLFYGDYPRRVEASVQRQDNAVVEDYSGRALDNPPVS